MFPPLQIPPIIHGLLSFAALASSPLGRAANPEKVPTPLRRDFAKIEKGSEWRSEEITVDERKLRLILELGRLDEDDPKASIDGSLGVLFGIAGSSVLGAFEFKQDGKNKVLSFTPIEGGGTPIQLPYHFEKDILIIDCAKIRWPGAGVLSKVLKFQSSNK